MIRKNVERIRMNGNLTGRHEGSKGVLNSEYVEHRSVSRESQATQNLMEPGQDAPASPALFAPTPPAVAEGAVVLER